MKEKGFSNFFLYGEPPKSTSPGFVHFESLSTRSKPRDWIIAPHKHADLHHIIAISSGAGSILFETNQRHFEGPRVIIVPANCIHGFEWEPRVQGMIMTIAELHLRQLGARHPDISNVFDEPDEFECNEDAIATSLSQMESAERELAWKTPAQSAAIESSILAILASVARQMADQDRGRLSVSARDLDLVARFRSLVEDRFRKREPIGVYAKELGVSLTTLRDACARNGQSPSQIRDQRAILEAQRLLSYSANPISLVGDKIGFDDPAYFSRFFARHCGAIPGKMEAVSDRTREPERLTERRNQNGIIGALLP